MELVFSGTQPGNVWSMSKMERCCMYWRLHINKKKHIYVNIHWYVIYYTTSIQTSKLNIYIYMYTVYQTYVWQNGNSWAYSNFGTHLRSFLSNPAAPLCWCPAIPWNWTISFHPMQPDATDPWMPGPPGWNLQWTKESRHVNGHFEYVCMSVCPSVCIYVCVCVSCVCEPSEKM